MKKKIVCLVLALIFVCGLILSAYQVFKQFNEYNQAKNFYSELYSLAELPEKKESTPDSSSEQSLTEDETVNLPKVDFESLKEINSELVGWIYFEGTVIDYPVVKGNDDVYYLDHMFNGEWNSSGSIFLDSKNDVDFSDKNSILYGHHMKNGTMFSKITKYKDQSYYDEHSEAFLLTPNQNYKVKLFSGYVADTDDNAWVISFEKDDDFLNWTKNLVEKSYFKCDVVPKISDRIITFSTCSYEFNNARFVLHGVLEEI